MPNEPVLVKKFYAVGEGLQINVSGMREGDKNELLAFLEAAITASSRFTLNQNIADKETVTLIKK